MPDKASQRRKELQQLLKRARPNGLDPKVGEVATAPRQRTVILLVEDPAIYRLLAQCQPELCRQYDAAYVRLIDKFTDDFLGGLATIQQRGMSGKLHGYFRITDLLR